MKLIVGLGNPEERYAGTRHNLGFEVVDKLGKSVKGSGESWQYQEKFKSEVCASRFPLILAKPQTYMNMSGLAVSKIASFYKISPEDIIIIHDELDLPLGHIKLRLGGAGAGHHGVESVIKYLGTDKFIRVRCGIGVQHFNAEHFVLEAFMPSEKQEVRRMIKKAVEAIQLLLDKGLTIAQSQYN